VSTSNSKSSLLGVTVGYELIIAIFA